MATYLCTFAGVPFFSDKAEPIQLPVQKGFEALQTYLDLQFPKSDMLDEIDRILPTLYLKDFASFFNYPSHNTNQLATQWPVTPQPAPNIRIGDWYYPSGASRWGVFRGLATSKMVKEMLRVTGGNQSAEFKIKQVPDSPSKASDSYYEISTQLFMLPPVPLAETASAFDGLYLVTLVDERFHFQWNGLSFRVTTTTTWNDLISQIATGLGVTITLPTVEAVYGQPEPDSQIWANSENAAAMLDTIAFNLGRVVVRGMDRTYTLQTTDESRTIIENNLAGFAKRVRLAGGDLFYSGGLLPVGSLTNAKNAVLPAAVFVTYPKYVIGNDPVPHFVNPRYADRPSSWIEDSYGDVFGVNVSIQSGGPLVSGLSGLATSQNFIHDTAKALYSGENQAVSGGVPLNVSGLTALAMQLAQDYYEDQVGAALNEVYPGIYDWTPEGLHDVVWTYSDKSRIAGTRLIRNEWNQVIREMQHATPFTLENPSLVGAGGHSVAQTWRDTASGNVVYGINLVTAGSGLYIQSGVFTSGGISEVVLIAAPVVTSTSGGLASGMIASGSVTNSNLASGVKSVYSGQVLVFYPTVFNLISGIAFYAVSGSIKNDWSIAPVSGTKIPSIIGGTHGQQLYLRNYWSGTNAILQHMKTLASGPFFWPLRKDYTFWDNETIIIEFDGSSGNASGVWRPDHPTFGTTTAASGNNSGTQLFTYPTRQYIVNQASGIASVHNYGGTVEFYLESGTISPDLIAASGMGAGPTVMVKLTPQSGSNTTNTFLRSDAAPALDQSIAPIWTGKHTFNGALATQSGITATIAANQNNYNPANLFSGTLVRLNVTSGAFDVTGLQAGTHGEIKAIHFVGSGSVNFKDESASSTNTNRWALLSDLSFTTDQAGLFQYDAITGRWRSLGSTVALGGINAQTGTSYTISAKDRGKLITFSNAGTMSGVLPQAGANFPNGWLTFVQNINAGGDLTITPVVSTIDGQPFINIGSNQGAIIFTDGVNYYTMRTIDGPGGNATLFSQIGGTPGIVKYTKNSSDFVANTATKEVNLDTLPGGYEILSCKPVVRAQLSGANIGTLNLAVGISGMATTFVNSATNLLSAISGFIVATNAVTQGNVLGTNIPFGTANQMSGVLINARLTSNTFLSGLNNGAIDFYFLVVKAT